MISHGVVTRERWDAARDQLLTREKQLTRLSDSVAEQRQRLPWLPLEREYTLQTQDGPKTLIELFDGRSQLSLYHFMFGPEYEAGCPTNSSIADALDPLVTHLKARDVTMICVSRAPLDQLDMDGLVALLREDALLRMPPQPALSGGRQIAEFFLDLALVPRFAPSR